MTGWFAQSARLPTVNPVCFAAPASQLDANAVQTLSSHAIATAHCAKVVSPIRPQDLVAERIERTPLPFFERFSPMSSPSILLNQTFRNLHRSDPVEAFVVLVLQLQDKLGVTGDPIAWLRDPQNGIANNQAVVLMAQRLNTANHR
jgi:hypothetical protein